MSELTKEYFDQTLAKFASKDDLKNLATKQDVQTMIDGAVENLAIIVGKGFDDVQDQLEGINGKLDTSKEIFGRKFTKLEEALNIKL